MIKILQHSQVASISKLEPVMPILAAAAAGWKASIPQAGRPTSEHDRLAGLVVRLRSLLQAKYQFMLAEPAMDGLYNPTDASDPTQGCMNPTHLSRATSILPIILQLEASISSMVFQTPSGGTKPGASTNMSALHWTAFGAVPTLLVEAHALYSAAVRSVFKLQSTPTSHAGLIASMVAQLDEFLPLLRRFQDRVAGFQLSHKYADIINAAELPSLPEQSPFFSSVAAAQVVAAGRQAMQHANQTRVAIERTTSTDIQVLPSTTSEDPASQPAARTSSSGSGSGGSRQRAAAVPPAQSTTISFCSHRLHCQSDGILTRCLLGRSAAAFAISPLVKRRLVNQIAKADLTVARQRWHRILLVDGSYCGTQDGDEFKALYFRLSSGGRLPAMTMAAVGSEQATWIDTAKTEGWSIELASGNAAGGPLREGVLYQAVKQTGAIDGWIFERQADGQGVIWLLQMTVGKKHDIKIGPLVFAIRALRQGEWVDADVRLAFVVPSWRADAYRSTHQYMVHADDQKATEEDWVDGASKKPALAAKMPKYYSPGSGPQWVKSRPTSDLRDANGLTVAPFTLSEAMDTVYGTDCGVSQWVWSCQATIDEEEDNP